MYARVFTCIAQKFSRMVSVKSLTCIPSHGYHLTTPVLSSFLLITHSILSDHSDGVGGEWPQTGHWIVHQGILFDIRPAVVLSEGLVVLRVEYIVVEVISPSDLRPLPTHSDCVTLSSLSNYLQTLTVNRRSCCMHVWYKNLQTFIIQLILQYHINSFEYKKMSTWNMRAEYSLPEHKKLGPSSFVL